MRRKTRVEVEIPRTRIEGRESFWLFPTSLSLIPKCSNDYKMISIAEMIYKKKRHIYLF